MSECPLCHHDIIRMTGMGIQCSGTGDPKHPCTCRCIQPRRRNARTRT